MSDVSDVDLANGDTTKKVNDQSDIINDNITVKDASAVLAKNKELLDLIRKEKQSKSELVAKVKEIEQAKLSAEGKKDELIAQLQSDYKKAASDLSQTKAKYAYKSIKNQVALKAKDLGCIDTEMLIKAMNLDSLQVSVVDDDFNIDEQNLMTELDLVRKSKSYLFKQPGPEIRDGVPINKTSKTDSLDFSKMTTKELIEYSKKLEHS